MHGLRQDGLLPFDPETPEEHQRAFELREEIYRRYVVEEAAQKRVDRLNSLVDDPNPTIREAARLELTDDAVPQLKAAGRAKRDAIRKHNNEARGFLRLRDR